MNDRSYLNDTESASGMAGVTLFLLGAACGAGLALLLAPATGGETRRKLGETARRLGSRASEVVGRMREGEPGGDSRSASDSRSSGDQAGEPHRSSGRREPLAGGRTQPGAQGTQS